MALGEVCHSGKVSGGRRGQRGQAGLAAPGLLLGGREDASQLKLLVGAARASRAAIGFKARAACSRSGVRISSSAAQGYTCCLVCVTPNSSSRLGSKRTSQRHQSS